MSIDILIITALKDELDALLDCEDESTDSWQKLSDSRGYFYHKRRFLHKNGSFFTIAAASAVEMAENAAVYTATRLSLELNPRCLAMTGICAGYRAKVFLGDVIVADRIFKLEHGKLIASYESKFQDRVRQEVILEDTKTYNLHPFWKYDVMNLSTDWVKTIKKPRPKSYCHQENWLLHTLYNDYRQNPDIKFNPAKHKEAQAIDCPDLPKIIEQLKKKGLIKKTDNSWRLTPKGRKKVEDELTLAENRKTDPLEPIVYVGAMGTTNRVQEDAELFPSLQKKQRNVLAVEMEGAAIGSVAEVEKIPMIVVKSVQDYGDHDKNDQFRSYAAETSARFLLALLKASSFFAQHIMEANRKPLENALKSTINPAQIAKVEGSEPDNLTTRITLTPNFKGRDNDIKRLEEIIDQGDKVILIYGNAGIGKTRLAEEFLSRFDLLLECRIGKKRDEVKSAPRVVEEWLIKFNQEPGLKFEVNLERLRQLLKDSSQKVGILIDNLENALDANCKLIEEHSQYERLLRDLATPPVQSITLITSLVRLRENNIGRVRYYHLQGLSQLTWEEYFQEEGIQTNSSAFSQVYEQWQGNAKAMEILRPVISKHYSGSVEHYWQETQGKFLKIHPDLEDLVTNEFNRLQQLGLQDSYNLLCRLGCYRYQENAPMQEGLLSLLWDVPDSEKMPVVYSLLDRGLVNFLDGKYRLHPAIRAVAIDKLQKEKNEDMQKANREAAKYFRRTVETIQTAQDALTALEAYYHYMAIDDYDSAYEIIVQNRPNELKGLWKNLVLNTDSLGNSFYRFGLFELMVEVIEKPLMVKKIKLPSKYAFSKICNLLGDLYMSKGEIIKALEYHSKSKKIADDCGHKYLQIASLTNQGICQIALREYEKARSLLEMAMSFDSGQAYKEEEDRFFVIARSALAFVYSCLKMESEAKEYAKKVYNGLMTVRLGPQGTGYRTIFLGLTYRNLGDIDKSFDMYDWAYSFAEENEYAQLKAQALIGLATIDNEPNYLDKAKQKLTQAIEILEQLGTKWDLAEAYYQLGVTLKKIGDKSHEKYFTKSTKLFKDIGH